MHADHTPINILIVDDEKRACRNLKNLLIEYVDPTLNIAGMAYSTKEAESKIAELSPAAVFLDIEMPNENAFHFLDRIAPFDFEVIFVTAYDEYAVKAFKLNAVDYILKPISIDELRNAVKKLKERLKYKSVINNSAVLYADISNQVNNKAKPTTITLRDINSVEMVDFKNICFIEAHGSYSRVLFFKNDVVKEMTMSSPLSDYADLLPPDLFYRIHRSYLINCSRIKNILSDDSNSVIMENNTTLPISRRRYVSLLEFLKIHNYWYE